MSKQKSVLVIHSKAASSMEYVHLYDDLKKDLLPGLPYYEVKHNGKALYAQLNEVNAGNKTNGRVYRKSDNKLYQFCSAAVLPIAFTWVGSFNNRDGSSFPGTTLEIGTIESTTEQTVKIWMRQEAWVNEPRGGPIGCRVIIGNVIGPSETTGPTGWYTLFDKYATTPVIVSIPKGTLKVCLQGYKPKWAGYTTVHTFVKITNSDSDNKGWSGEV